MRTRQEAFGLLVGKKKQKRVQSTPEERSQKYWAEKLNRSTLEETVKGLYRQLPSMSMRALAKAAGSTGHTVTRILEKAQVRL